MKFSSYFTLLIALLGIGFFIKINHIKSQKTNSKIAERKAIATKARQTIDSIQQASQTEIETMDLIIELADDHDQHKKVGKKLSDQKINEIENKIGLSLPDSYKMFLKYFGDGTEQIYNDPEKSIGKITRSYWLTDHKKNIGDKIETTGKIYIDSSSLLCLPTENSKDGTWCLITSKEEDDWSLAYYNHNDQKLHHKVPNFTEWLKMIVSDRLKTSDS